MGELARGSTPDFRVLVVPGDHRPTVAEVQAADLVLKLTPPSARVQLLGQPGLDHARVKIRRWPNGWSSEA